jgi:hypothetical protein
MQTVTILKPYKWVMNLIIGPGMNSGERTISKASSLHKIRAPQIGALEYANLVPLEAGDSLRRIRSSA